MLPRSKKQLLCSNNFFQDRKTWIDLGSYTFTENNCIKKTNVEYVKIYARTKRRPVTIFHWKKNMCIAISNYCHFKLLTAYNQFYFSRFTFSILSFFFFCFFTFGVMSHRISKQERLNRSKIREILIQILESVGDLRNRNLKGKRFSLLLDCDFISHYDNLPLWFTVDWSLVR